MIEVSTSGIRPTGLETLARIAAACAAKWRDDDAFLHASFRAVGSAINGELDRRARGLSPAVVTIDLPLVADADPAIARTGLMLLPVAFERLARFGKPEEQRFWGDLAAAAANLEAERRADERSADGFAFGAPVLEREVPGT